MPVMGVSKFQRFFRVAADLNVDKDDLKRYSDFVNQKIYDLLIVAEATARANDRGMIEPHDLPITKGLQESMHAFKKLDEEIELKPILEHLAGLPQLDLLFSDEVRDRLPLVAGGLSVALARTLQIIEPHHRHPATAQWERAFRIFDTLL
jgi:hypothetical protein